MGSSHVNRRPALVLHFRARPRAGHQLSASLTGKVAGMWERCNLNQISFSCEQQALAHHGRGQHDQKGLGLSLGFLPMGLGSPGLGTRHHAMYTSFLLSYSNSVTQTNFYSPSSDTHLCDYYSEAITAILDPSERSGSSSHVQPAALFPATLVHAPTLPSRCFL